MPVASLLASGETMAQVCENFGLEEAEVLACAA